MGDVQVNGPAFVHDLATAIGGEVRGNTLIVIREGDVIRIVDCRPTGRVLLDGTHQLGTFSDGVEHLAARYYGATSEVCS